MAKLDTNNKTFILNEHDLKRTLDWLKLKGNVEVVMKEDEASPIEPIERILFVREEGGIDG